MVFLGASPQTPWVGFAEFRVYDCLPEAYSLASFVEKKTMLPTQACVDDLKGSVVEFFCEAEQTLLLLFWKRRPYYPCKHDVGCRILLRSRTNAFASFLEKKTILPMQT
jgi:hypothetical protein